MELFGAWTEDIKIEGRVDSTRMILTYEMDGGSHRLEEFIINIGSDTDRRVLKTQELPVIFHQTVVENETDDYQRAFAILWFNERTCEWESVHDILPGVNVFLIYEYDYDDSEDDICYHAYMIEREKDTARIEQVGWSFTSYMYDNKEIGWSGKNNKCIYEPLESRGYTLSDQNWLKKHEENGRKLVKTFFGEGYDLNFVQPPKEHDFEYPIFTRVLNDNGSLISLVPGTSVDSLTDMFQLFEEAGVRHEFY